MQYLLSWLAEIFFGNSHVVYGPLFWTLEGFLVVVHMSSLVGNSGRLLDAARVRRCVRGRLQVQHDRILGCI